MASAVIGLLGAFLGAVIALVGSMVSARLQVRQENIRWRRDRRQAGYEAAVRYILRAANRRSHIIVATGRVMSIMSEDFVREWFDDLIEAQSSMRSLTAVCGEQQVARLKEAAGRIDEVVLALDSTLEPLEGLDFLYADYADRGLEPVKAIGPKAEVIQKLREIVSVVVECGREDLAAFPPVRDDRRADWGNEIPAAEQPAL